MALFAQVWKAAEIAGESLAVALEDEYCDGMVQRFGLPVIVQVPGLRRARRW